MNADLTKGRRNIQQPQHSRVTQLLFLIDTSVWGIMSLELTEVPPEYSTQPQHSRASQQLFLIDTNVWGNLSTGLITKGPLNIKQQHSKALQ
jgi:hypothetical protein